MGRGWLGTRLHNDGLWAARHRILGRGILVFFRASASKPAKLWRPPAVTTYEYRLHIGYSYPLSLVLLLVLSSSSSSRLSLVLMPCLAG